MSNIRVGIVGVIRRGEKILLGQRRKLDAGFGKWVFPGGGIEGEESLQEALSRECEEEVGLQVEIGRIITATRSAHSGKNNVALIYWAIPRDPLAEPRETEEIGSPQFFTLAEAEALDVMPVTQQIFDLLRTDISLWVPAVSTLQP